MPACPAGRADAGRGEARAGRSTPTTTLRHDSWLTSVCSRRYGEAPPRCSDGVVNHPSAGSAYGARIPDLSEPKSRTAVHGSAQILFAADVALCGLNGRMSQKELDLFQFAASGIAQTRASPPQVVMGERLDVVSRQRLPGRAFRKPSRLDRLTISTA